MKTYNNRNEVIDDLKGIIADTLNGGLGKEKVTEEADFRTTFLVFNAEVGRLATPLNKAFGCNLTPDAARCFQNAGGIVNWLEEKGFICYNL